MQSFKEYYQLLTERVVGNKFYFFSESPLEKEYLKITKEYDKVYLYSKKDYINYLKNITIYVASDPRFNYIYQIDKNLNIFEFTPKDFQYILKIGNIIDESKFQEIEKIVGGINAPYGYILKKYFNQENFFKVFDGYLDRYDSNIVNVKSDILLKYNKLIDGNIKRFGKENNIIDFKPPDFVEDELNHYTALYGRKLKLNTKNWLKNNTPKPYKSKTLYRSFHIEFKTDLDTDHEMKILKRNLFKFIGVKKLEDLYIGNTVIMKRDKESSWSTDPQIARNFASGMSQAEINILIKAEVNAENIILDFSELPLKYKSRFKFHSQNEVIVDDVNIDATINSIWFDSDMIGFLQKQGYKVTQNGIFA